MPDNDEHHRAKLTDVPTNLIVAGIFPYLDSRGDWNSLSIVDKDIQTSLASHRELLPPWPENCQLAAGCTTKSYLRDPEWSPCGRHVACHDTVQIHIFDRRDGHIRRWVPHGRSSRRWTVPVSSLKFAPNGRFLVTSGYGRRVKIWDCHNDYNCIHDWDLLGESTSSRVAVSPDSSLVAVLQSGLVCLVGVDDGAVTHTVPLEMGVISCVLFTPDGRSLIFGGEENNDGVIKIWRIEDFVSADSLVNVHTADRLVHDLALSPDGSFLVSAGSDTKMKLWKLTAAESNDALECVQIFDCPDSLRSVSFTPCGAFLAVGGGDDDFGGFLQFWRIADNVCTRAVATNGAIKSIRYSPDGSRCIIQDDHWIFVRSLDPSDTEKGHDVMNFQDLYRPPRLEF